MARPRPPEARLVDTRQVLVLLSPADGASPAEDFAGTVVTDPSAGLPDLAGKAVYLCGDLARSAGLDLSAASRVLVVEDVGPGRVPIDVHGLGVYYRRFFGPADDYVERIRAEHTFQSLTESTKPGTAHRTGIYLTPVRRERDALRFRLLRCSTNLSGPTDDFRATDHHIVDALNQEASLVFDGAAPLNHVLAQIYLNTPADAGRKQTKARISSHADKTKDMPGDGVMAFCTFYEHLDRLDPMPGDPFDRGHRGITGLTRLRFRHKVTGEQFTITLYPNSVLFVPLSTNRHFTHEIVPSELEAARLPTRLGYVVRCSTTEAVHEDGRTFLLRDGGRVELEAPTPEGMTDLRRLYAEENKSSAHVDYGDGFRFSMNTGDYRAPIHHPSDLFRTYPVDTPPVLFTSARLEPLGKGRRGAVLVAPDPRGTPVVRTTTAYTLPAQCFGPAHTALAQRIRTAASLAVGFNNALLEIYTSAYPKMGAHSDQALDLDEAGAIALFTCYENPEAEPTRQLVVEPKDPGDPPFTIPLRHGEVVVFSAGTNRRFRHRIMLDRTAADPDNTWLGLTFRTSATFVRFDDGQPRLADGTPLTLADEQQRDEFLRLRRRENQETDFVWPRLTWTVNPSDLRPPG